MLGPVLDYLLPWPSSQLSLAINDLLPQRREALHEEPQSEEVRGQGRRQVLDVNIWSFYVGRHKRFD